jgi:hypothetical protein
MISTMCARSRSVPWPEPYCSAAAASSSSSLSNAVAISSRGIARTYGMPPASDTTSGREATANRARTSLAASPAVRAA